MQLEKMLSLIESQYWDLDNEDGANAETQFKFVTNNSSITTWLCLAKENSLLIWRLAIRSSLAYLYSCSTGLTIAFELSAGQGDMRGKVIVFSGQDVSGR